MFSTHSRKSILSSVLHINLTVALVLTVLFVISSIFYSQQLRRERYYLARTKLSQLNKDFQIEMQRLDALLTLCLQDASLVYTLSDRLGPDFFRNNSYAASTKLALMRRSLPYAKTVFLYTRSSQRIIQDNGALYTENDFLRIVLNTAAADTLISIRDLPDGLYQYNGSNALYVKHLYYHGYIAVQINLPEFAYINKTINEGFLGYVIRKDGHRLIGNTQITLTPDAIRAALTADFITVGNTKYYCTASVMKNLPYIGLVLINNDALMAPLHYMYVVMGIMFLILCAGFLLLVLLNYKIYLPLKKFTAQFGNSGDNEIAILKKQIHELLVEISFLTKNTQQSEPIPEKIALHYLLSCSAQLDGKTSAMLEKKYPYYMIMAIAIQNQSGGEDIDFAAALEKTLTENFTLRLITLDKYTFSIVAKPEDKEKIIALLESVVAAANQEREKDKALQMFIGIREYCTSICDLYAEHKFAERSLLASPVKKELYFSYTENKNLPQKRMHLSLEQQNTLFEYARNNALEPLRQTLEHIFYPQQPCTLADFRSFYFNVLSIFEKACIAKKIAPPALTDGTFPYNTHYMYQTLGKLSSRFFSDPQGRPQNTKKQMETYIVQHLSEPLTLNTVADAFSITPVYLSGWFKKNMGMNFLTFISAARMNHAVKLLCQPHPPKIHEIAAAVGISNTATFIRQFKKYTGTTPSQYQKNWAGKA